MRLDDPLPPLFPSHGQLLTTTVHHGRFQHSHSQLGYLCRSQRILGIVRGAECRTLRLIKRADPFTGCSGSGFEATKYELPDRHRRSVRCSELHLLQGQQFYVSRKNGPITIAWTEVTRY